MARGRQSAAALSTRVVAGNFGERPEPPAELSGGAAEVWRRTVASEPADFFKTAALRTMLADYCRHVEAGDILGAQIDAFDMDWLKSDDGLKRYDMLLKLRERETRSSADKATKLRLTNQSRYTPGAAATAAKREGVERKPWETSA